MSDESELFRRCLNRRADFRDQIFRLVDHVIKECETRDEVARAFDMMVEILDDLRKHARRADLEDELSETVWLG